MSYLKNYKIPAIQTDALNVIDCFAAQSNLHTINLETNYNNFQRFVSPGKQGTSYRPPLKRKYNDALANGFPPSKISYINETTKDGKLAIIIGRDPSYPEELNLLIHPGSCELCGVQVNSPCSAKDHYQSKTHDRRITQWLNKNYVEKGLKAPEIVRLYKAGPTGKTGPEAFHCELCDIHLTSLTHAKQHYAGRRHRLVAENKSKPSGAGYYDANGKWVRTARKANPHVANDGRFGIGEQFLQQKIEEAAIKIETEQTTTATATTTPKAVVTATAPNDALDDSLFCSICNIRVTSATQMQTHLVGHKHQNKLKIACADPTIKVENIPKTNDTVLAASLQDNEANDLSMYRTPSGSYYCKNCNVSLCHISALQQHLIGKKHAKNVSDVKTENASNND